MNTNRFRSNIYLLVIGIFLSAILYSIHYLIFRDLNEALEGVISAIAFVPIGLIYQVFIINKILERRDELRTKKKATMIIGFFFVEIGNDIMSMMVEGDRNLLNLKKSFPSYTDLVQVDLKKVEKLIIEHECDMDLSKIDLLKLEKRLDAQDEFIVSLIISPFFENNESFSDMLTLLILLRDALQTKYYNGGYSEVDLENIKKGICKSYKYLMFEWIRYLDQIREFYPFIYLKALINSPFNKKDDDK